MCLFTVSAQHRRVTCMHMHKGNHALVVTITVVCLGGAHICALSSSGICAPDSGRIRQKARGARDAHKGPGAAMTPWKGKPPGGIAVSHDPPTLGPEAASAGGKPSRGGGSPPLMIPSISGVERRLASCIGDKVGEVAGDSEGATSPLCDWEGGPPRAQAKPSSIVFGVAAT
mmetsp:Transcript_6160/g.18979  ORF Transcript_6160/g.18979 Transcript_6160/m.18979 type:complete len:172 (-) Transcript_6160:332-847(-)